MPEISKFIANMGGGGARPNQFQVEIAFPSDANAFIKNGTLAVTATKFLCHATALPASDIQDIALLYRGRPVHFAGERVFGQWTISIYNDEDFLIRDAFESWSHYITRLNSTRGQVAPRSYVATMNVTQLNRNNQPLRHYQFNDCYPISVGQIGLNFDAQGIETFDVTFVYNYFLIKEGKGLPQFSYPDSTPVGDINSPDDEG
jgi:hypothetical protein